MAVSLQRGKVILPLLSFPTGTTHTGDLGDGLFDEGKFHYRYFLSC
jgi:hypothetical protein